MKLTDVGLVALLDQIQDNRLEVSPTVMMWKNRNQDGHFKGKYVATVNGTTVDGDDLDLTLYLACQKYFQHMKQAPL